MKTELETTQTNLQSNDYDLFLSYIVKREKALDIIKNSTSNFTKRDRYKQVKKLNQKIESLKRKWGFKE